jgi:replication factor C small subunit
MATELWVEKFRPSTLDGYVFRNAHQHNQVKGWIDDKSIPHLLLSGSAGIGKTTLAKILFNELDINPLDIMEVNASRDNGVGNLREKITNFVQMIPFGDFKIVLLDEADFLTLNAQASLRGVMEEYHNTARFILTCNYPNRIIPALHSRCQMFAIDKPDQTEFTARIATILLSENIQFDLDTIDTFVKATYPDLRKCINTVQMNCQSGVLVTPEKGDTSTSDYKIEMVELFKKGKIAEARKLVCAQARPEEIEGIFRWLYENVELFGDEDKQEKAIMIIKQGLLDHVIVIDSEINLAATLIRLARL